MHTLKEGTARCSCGAVVLEALEPALFRLYCHCTICQQYNDAAYADITAFYAKSIGPVDESKIKFKVHQQPPLVQRGTCIRCGKAALEKIAIPLMPKLIAVPSGNFDNLDPLPAPRMHIFYGSRVADAEDDLKKHSGFLSSQFGYCAALLTSMFSRSRS